MGHSYWTELVKKYHDKLGGPLKNSMKAAAKSPEWKAHKTLNKTKKRGGTTPVVRGGDEPVKTDVAEVEVKDAEPAAEPAPEPAAVQDSVAGVEVGGRKRRKSSRKSRKGGRKSRKHR